MLQTHAGMFEYAREQIMTGQIWRLWTGHFVHGHMTHLVFNAIAAAALFFMFMSRVRKAELLTCALAFPVLISFALLLLYPDLAWYRGLSGVLHPVVGYFCVRFARTESKLYWLGLVMLGAKVVVEALRAQAGHQGELAGMAVATQAHLVGAWVGVLCALACLAVDWRARGRDKGWCLPARWTASPDVACQRCGSRSSGERTVP